MFKKHILRMSLEKTGMMWVGHQREKLNIRLDGKEIKQVDGFVYLGGMVFEIFERAERESLESVCYECLAWLITIA